MLKFGEYSPMEHIPKSSLKYKNTKDKIFVSIFVGHAAHFVSTNKSVNKTSSIQDVLHSSIKSSTITNVFYFLWFVSALPYSPHIILVASFVSLLI